MRNLYIIGNGFDLAHNLPTSFASDYKKILKKIDEKLFDIVDEKYFDHEEDLWRYFESEIGIPSQLYFSNKFNHANDIVERYKQEHSDPDDYRAPFDSEKYYAVDITYDNATHQARVDMPDFEDIFTKDQVDDIFDFLQSNLETMVENANLLLKDQEPIINNLSNNDKYINFNYTLTLEEIYSIDSENILHVHGTLGEELVFGNSQESLDSIDFGSNTFYFDNDHLPPVNPYSEYASMLESFIEAAKFDEQEFSSFEDRFLQETKDSESTFLKILQPQIVHDFLKKSGHFERIITIGHSLGEVDLPYMRIIKNMHPDAKWTVTYYSDAEFDRISETMLNLGIKDAEIVRFNSFTNHQI